MAGLCLVVGGCGSNGQRVRKIGLQGLDAHTATAVRAVIMAAFWWPWPFFSAAGSICRSFGPTKEQ